jgi:hypothetical protein
MATKFHFFTNADLLAPQLPSQAFGSAGTVNGADLYRTTSLHTADPSKNVDPTAYAVCAGVVCVQEISNTNYPALVNLVLRPREQPALNFVPIKYIIYKGILRSSLINGNEVAQASTNQLTQSIWKSQAKKNAAANTHAKPPAEALGVGFTAAASPQFADDQPIDNFFYQAGAQFQLQPVMGGWRIGQFDRASFGIEILLEGLGFRHEISLARKLENLISVPALPAQATPAQKFDHRHAKEQVLGFMDPCAFYGSFFGAEVHARSSTGSAFEPKGGKALYVNLLSSFLNRNTAYLDIRNEHNYSLNYFRNYTDTIQLSYDPGSTAPSAVDYYGSGWPLLALHAPNFPANNTTRARNAFKIQLPVGDNPKPLLYLSQGYRDVGAKGDGFPPKLNGSARFFDGFGSPGSSGYTATGSTSRSSMTFVVPNVTSLGTTTPVSCYTRIKYLKQQQGMATASTVVPAWNFLDNLVYPLDLHVPFAASAQIRSSVFDEDVYVNAVGVAGLECDFIGKMGIAHDAANTSLFVLPTCIRKQSGQASAVVSLSGEVSGFTGGYPNFVALKYPLERVLRSDLVLSGNVPVAEFVSDGDAAAQAKFNTPDFSKLMMIVVANATYDAWMANVPATLDPRFRIYLGAKNLQSAVDDVGNSYTSFELVLRGFMLDTSTDDYSLQEVNTDPVNPQANVKAYAHAGS